MSIPDIRRTPSGDALLVTFFVPIDEVDALIDRLRQAALGHDARPAVQPTPWVPLADRPLPREKGKVPDGVSEAGMADPDIAPKPPAHIREEIARKLDRKTQAAGEGEG